MGYVKHRFFVVHSSFGNPQRIEDARVAALLAFAHAPHLVGPVMDSVVNDVSGFIVWTSGSKMGWDDANQHDAALADLIERLSAMPTPPSWCLTSSGEEPGDISAEQGYDGNFTHRYRRKVVGRKE